MAASFYSSTGVTGNSPLATTEESDGTQSTSPTSFYSESGLASENITAIQSSTDAAQTSETNAANSATSAANSATQADTAKVASETAQAAAEAASTGITSSASSAATSASDSASSATAAASSATSASTDAATATTQANNSASSATTATTKASEASTSASNASTSETNASASETAAAASETAAATSETNAATSETNSASSETAAAASETAAAASETAASASETAAAASETAAAASETAAAASETAAATSETNAATSETNAATSATNSAASATASAASASTASTKASDASTSASNAATSETNAATSATNAASSATDAQTAQAATELAFDNFDDKFLGTFSSDPTTDNDGDALVTGAMYYNDSSNAIKFYNGTAWEAPETAASNSATSATTSATNAATSATNAASSATAAATSETNAASSLADFTGQYSSGATDPTTNLNTGDLFFNTTVNELKIYNGSSWQEGVTTGNATQSDDGLMSSSDKTKLDGVETGATSDQTDAEIKTAYENNSDTNAFTDVEKTKLTGIEANATADQTDAEIKTAYENNTDTNAFTDALQTKLNGIEASADVTDTTNVVASLTAGDNITIADDGTVAAGGGEITVQDEGVDLSTAATTLNFTGNGVVASGTGAAKTINITDTNTTYSVATTSADGLMSSTDKTKIDGVEASADVTDTTNVVASLTAGTNITIAADGTISSSGGSNADTLDNLNSTQFLRSDASDSTSGTLTVSPSSDQKIVLSGSSSPYIRWQENSTDKFYIQWSTSGYPLFRNQETGNFVFRPAGTTTGVRFRLQASDGDDYGSVYGDHNNDIGFLDQDGHWAYRHRNSSIHNWRINNTTEMDLTTSQLDLKGNNLVNVTDLYVADQILHTGDTDTYIQFATNEIRMRTANSQEVTINSTGVRLGDTGNGYFQPVSGSYGSIQIDGGAHGGWEGYSIGGRVVFMHDNGNNMGLYNDVNNEWMFYGILNAATYMYYNGANKFQTTSGGAQVNGTLSVTGSISGGAAPVMSGTVTTVPVGGYVNAYSNYPNNSFYNNPIDQTFSASSTNVRVYYYNGSYQYDNINYGTWRFLGRDYASYGVLLQRIA